MRKTTLVVLAVALGSCRCAPHRGLSPDAAAIFSRADEPGAGGALVIDLDQARQLGLLKPGGNGFRTLTDLGLYLLPGIAAEMQGEPLGQLAARSSVLLGILRDWAKWPRVQRFGLLVPAPLPGQPVDALVNGMTLVLAVRGSTAANQELLQGIAALARAGGRLPLKSANGDLCYTGPALGADVCVQAGDGYFAASSPQGLATLLPGKGTPRPKAHPPALVFLHADIPALGQGTLSVSGTSSVQLAAMVAPADEGLAKTLESTAKDYLAKLDQTRAKTRSTLAPELKATQAALAQDPKAPASLKATAASMTVDRLLDPDGNYGELRKSVLVERKGNRVSLALTVPAKVVRQFVKPSGLMTTVAVGGILAAIAIPNFLKYQARSKQSECQANLRAFFTAEKAYYQEKDSYSASISDVGFEPERGNRYAYFASATGPLEDRSGASLSPAVAGPGGASGVGVDVFRFPDLRPLQASDLPPLLAGSVPLGLTGQCPACQITMACASTLSAGGSLDVWSISTQVRFGPRGIIRAGEPFNDLSGL